MAGENNIKRGVSLYSFQEEYFLRKMSLQDCIAAAAKLDIPGIELIGEQMAPGFPDPGDAWFANWHKWLEQYGRTPVCHDQFLDTSRYKGRLLSEEEMVASVVRDLKFANQIGATVMRMIVITPPEIMELAAPYAEQYNVRMGIEIHSPWSLDHDWIKRHIEVMDRVNSSYLGFIPDMGIFTKSYPRVVSERIVRNGGQPHIVNYIVERYNSHEPLDDLDDKVVQMGGNTQDLAAAATAHHLIYSDPRRLLEQMPRLFHIHAKFNEMLPDYTEESIPYEEVIPVLIEGGFSGYMSSEYEGNRHIEDAYEVDSVEQVRRHQEMLKRLLGH